MKTLTSHPILSTAVAAALALTATNSLAFDPAAAVSTSAEINTGWYDHQQIWYARATLVLDGPAAIQLINQGTVVFHVVDPDGNTSPFQLVFPIPPTGGVHTDGNVLSAIPTEVGYTGGAWNLQIFHWNGPPSRALTKDDDIRAAASAGEGWIEVTAIVVRCPLIDFSNLR
jgi:hypothetical protein